MAKKNKSLEELVIKVHSKELQDATKQQDLLGAKFDYATDSVDSLNASLKGTSSAIQTAIKMATSLNDQLNKAGGAKGLDQNFINTMKSLSSIEKMIKDIQTLSQTELGIKVNNKGIKTALDNQTALGERMVDAAAGAELLNTELAEIITKLESAKAEARGLANNFEGMGDVNLQDMFDGVVGAIQNVEGYLHELVEEFQHFSGQQKKGSDELVVGLERLLDPLRNVKTSTGLTQKEIEKMGKAAGYTEDQIDQLTKATEGASRSSKGGARNFADMARFGGTLTMAYAAIAANVYALTAAFDQLAQGDRLNRLHELSGVIGAETGTSLSQLSEAMVEASGHAIGFEEAMKQAAQASGYGFSTQQIEDFTLAARRASVALGVDLNDALNRVIKGVSKLEPELLDELGITIKLTEAYENYAKKINVSVTALTSYQKQQAYANAVAEESAQRFGYLDDQLKSTEWETLGANIAEAVNKGRMFIADFLEPAAKILNEDFQDIGFEKTIGSLQKLSESMKQASGQNKGLQFASIQVQGSEEVQKARQELQKYRKQLSELKKLQANPTGNETGKELFEMQKGIVFQQEAVAGLSMELDNYTIIMEKSFASTTGLTQGTKEFNDALDSMFETLHQSTSLSKTLPDSMSKFKGSITETSTPIESLNSNLTLAVDTVERLQKEQSRYNYLTQDGAKIISNIQKDIDKHLKQSGVQNEEQLRVLQAQAQEYEKITLALRKANLEKQQVAQQNQFATGATSQIKQALYELENIQKKIEQGSKKTTTITGSTSFTDGQPTPTGSMDMLGEKELLALKTQETQLQMQLNDLYSANNKTQAQFRDTVAETATIQQEMNREDELQSKLKEVNAKKASQQKYLTQNVGLMKPEDIASAEKEIKAFGQEQQSIQDQMSERSYQRKLSTAEIYKNEYLIANLATEKDAQYTQELQFLNTKSALLDEELKKQENQSQEKQNQLKIEKQQVELTKQAQEAAFMAQQQSKNLESIDREQTEKGKNEIHTLEQLAKQEEEYAEKLKQTTATEEQRTQQDNAAADAKLRLADAIRQEQIQHQSMASGMLGQQGSMPTITSAGANQSDDQLDQQQMQTGAEAVGTAMGELASYAPQMNDMIANLGNLGMAFIQMGEGQSTGQQVAAAGMATVASMLNASSSQAVNSIDQQIAAEKERDGQSEESKEKIEKLEAEKMQIQQKAATQQIVMQTAMGITQALATLPPPISYVMAGTTAAMGAVALSAQQSATSIPSVDDSTPASLSLGEKENNVDTSLQATAGELSYIHGDEGSGSISNYKPRQVGNRAPANHEVMVGENGPEVVAFDAPGTVTPQNKVGEGSGQQTNVTYNISAMDSASFQEFLARNSDVLANTMEYKLNSTGKSLYRR